MSAFDVEPVLNQLAWHVLDVYRTLSVSNPDLTSNEFHTLQLLLVELDHRWKGERLPGLGPPEWTPRRINDLRHLEQKGWLGADELSSDWFRRVVGQWHKAQDDE